MKLAIFAYSRRGCRTVRKFLPLFSGDTVTAYTLERFQEPGFDILGKGSFYGELFSWADAMIFVSSCGIAVRQIAPYVRSKLTDPAVVVMDEGGQFVIPLLSGHIGGANDLAKRLAAHLGTRAVVTTATDVNGKFSVDSWAARQGFRLSSMKAAKAVSAEILERPVPMDCRFPVVSDYPAGVVPGSGGKIGIYVGYHREEPFDTTLRLIPPVLHLGIGCRRDTAEAAIEQAVDRVLQETGLDPAAICCAASIDLKKDEQGLLAFCKNRNIPVSFYTAGELQAVPGEFTASPFVAKVTGVDNVCERAALLGADRLIVGKTALNGVTVAVAAEKLEVKFG